MPRAKLRAPRQLGSGSMLGNIQFCLTLISRVTKNIILNTLLPLIGLAKLTIKLILVSLQATSDILDSISEACGFIRSILSTIFDTLLTLQELIEAQISRNISQFARELHNNDW